jgi:hypothetical protein
MTQAGNTDKSPERAERIRRALQSLGETLSDLAQAVEEKKGERCPYRDAQDRCTFRGGCVNKVRERDGTKRCGGDHRLNWSQIESQERK